MLCLPILRYRAVALAGFLTAIILATACGSAHQNLKGPPPDDPLTDVEAKELRATGLAYARRGDLTRGQQYLSAALVKGFDETIIVPELVKVCLAASRLRAALRYGQEYLVRHPADAGMRFVVGNLHLALGNLTEATTHLEGAREVDAFFPDATYALALVAQSQGQTEAYQEYLHSYLQHAPNGRYAERVRSLVSDTKETP